MRRGTQIKFHMLHARLLLAFLPALGLVLYMGMDSETQEYAKSPQEVRTALKQARVPTHVLGSGISGSRVTTPDDNTVITALLDRDGVEIVHFVTSIETDGTGSEVSTEIAPAGGEAAERARAKLENNQILGEFMEQLAQEHVAAAIEGRPFNMMFATGPAGDAMMNAIPGLGDQIQQANASAAAMAEFEQEMRDREQQNRFRKEYGDDWGASGLDPNDDWGSQ